jgi:hypothetical protein
MFGRTYFHTATKLMLFLQDQFCATISRVLSTPEAAHLSLYPCHLEGKLMLLATGKLKVKRQAKETV